MERADASGEGDDRLRCAPTNVNKTTHVQVGEHGQPVRIRAVDATAYSGPTVWTR